jgi:hypothetical protein
MTADVATMFLWVLLSTPLLFAQTLPEGIWQGIRRGMEARFPPVDRIGRGHPSRKVRLATRGRSPLHQ